MNKGWKMGVAALALSLGTAFAQQAPQSRNAEEVYKNILVLKGTPADSFGQGMHLMTAALGVTCEYCHIEGDFANDSIAKKKIARAMVTLTNRINQTFGGHTVTCYTCHHGNAVPAAVPSLPMAGPVAAAKANATLPSVEDVLAKYVAAVGGEKAVQSVKSVVIRSTQDIPTGPGGVIPLRASVEEYRKAPGLVLTVAKATDKGKEVTMSSGFDGKQAWAQDARGRVSAPAAMDQIRAKRSADLYEALHIKENYQELRVAGSEKVNGRDAYVVIGMGSEEVATRFYFDAENGLLLRKYSVTPTEAGASPFQEDYSDYRAAASGVKYAYKIERSPAGMRTELPTHSTVTVEKIEENVAIDDAKFQKPTPPPPPAAPAK
ncbi:MAG: photosynthetic reaction center cytochrome c subunit family protein [Bryobacteraceae bacterium]